MSIRKILVANRGEIAVRVIKAAKELGKKCVGIYSKQDRFLPHTFLADEAYPLSGKTIAETYLDIDQILYIAKKAKADAIHPGYGFLSEKAEFAERCRKEGVIFIGPEPESIATMGEKMEAKLAMKRGGVSVIPGSEGILASKEEAKSVARKIGYPVLLKAVYGGGGERHAESLL